MRPARTVYAAAIAAALLASPVVAAPDRTQGVALMSATVAANGNLVRGSGVVSSIREAVGSYIVTFERPIDTCVAAGNVSQGIGVEFQRPVPGSVSAAFLGEPNEAMVVVTDADGQNDDLGFQLLLFCPK
jgi:hypothetical protein